MVTARNAFIESIDRDDTRTRASRVQARTSRASCAGRRHAALRRLGQLRGTFK
jgi:hypothetical protein